MIEWAPGEPRDIPNVNCAYLKKSEGYKMVTDMCQIPRKFICMALSPNCPAGYQWVAKFGNGRSCFKLTPSLMDATSNKRDMNTASKLCLKEKTRLATPYTVDDTEALIEHYKKDAYVPIDIGFQMVTGALKVLAADGTEYFNLPDRYIIFSYIYEVLYMVLRYSPCSFIVSFEKNNE